MYSLDPSSERDALAEVLRVRDVELATAQEGLESARRALMLKQAEKDIETARVRTLENAIRKVVTQRADDLCWRDVYTDLAKLVGVEFCPALICDPEKFIANCRQFDASLRGGGKYQPVYVEKMT